MTHFECKWQFNDRVVVDGDSSIKAVVTAIAFRVTGRMIEVSWFHNGECRFAWIEEYRLSEANG